MRTVHSGLVGCRKCHVLHILRARSELPRWIRIRCRLRPALRLPCWPLQPLARSDTCRVFKLHRRLFCAGGCVRVRSVQPSILLRFKWCSNLRLVSRRVFMRQLRHSCACLVRSQHVCNHSFSVLLQLRPRRYICSWLECLHPLSRCLHDFVLVVICAMPRRTREPHDCVADTLCSLSSCDFLRSEQRLLHPDRAPLTAPRRYC